MFKEDQLRKIEEAKKSWEKDLSNSLSETPERLPRFTTLSDVEIKGLYSPEDISGIDYVKDLGFPGIVSLHARGPSLHVPGKTLDHEDVLRIRGSGGNEPALSLSPRSR